MLVLEVVNSNPNGDPDNESDPRHPACGWGEISPVSFKRKLRDLVEEKSGPVGLETAATFVPPLDSEQYDILEKRGRNRDKIKSEINDGSFTRRYWDGRLFGNTFLEENASTSIQDRSRSVRNGAVGCAG
jgi:Cas7 group CRISPR-associated protein Csh2